MSARVLVLDGNQRSALAVTRSLGARGIPVIAADVMAPSLAGCSRYAGGCITYPDPAIDSTAFIHALARIVREHDVGVLLPMTDITTALVLQYRDVFDVAIPFPDYEIYEKLANKQRLASLANTLGIPVPATHVIHTAEERFDVYKRLRFPVVIKPVYSKVKTANGWIAVGVKYADSMDELESIVSIHPCLGAIPLLIQQRIDGYGHGIFALYDHGRPVAHFAHRRLRERPPSGGVSVLSESVAPHPVSLGFADTLLHHAGWHGVAMVEFKVDAQGTPYLMEVNGRFWGSLQLAIDSGVDFPFLLYRMARGESVDMQEGQYVVGRRSRWLLGDLDHLYWILWKERHHHTWRQRMQALLSFARFYEPQTRYEVNRLDDWRPFMHELRAYFLGT